MSLLLSLLIFHFVTVVSLLVAFEINLFIIKIIINVLFVYSSGIGFRPRRSAVNSTTVHLRLVAGEVQLGQIFLSVRRFCLSFIILECSIIIYHRPLRYAAGPIQNLVSTTSVRSG